MLTQIAHACEVRQYTGSIGTADTLRKKTRGQTEGNFRIWVSVTRERGRRLQEVTKPKLTWVVGGYNSNETHMDTNSKTKRTTAAHSIALKLSLLVGETCCQSRCNGQDEDSLLAHGPDLQ